jgi:hypothetical protein
MNEPTEDVPTWLAMSPNYHGATYAQIGELVGVAASTVKSWFHRYPDLHHARSRDGYIDVVIFTEWYDHAEQRNLHQAKRRGKAGIEPKPRGQVA